MHGNSRILFEEENIGFEDSQRLLTFLRYALRTQLAYCVVYPHGPEQALQYVFGAQRDFGLSGTVILQSSDGVNNYLSTNDKQF